MPLHSAAVASVGGIAWFEVDAYIRTGIYATTYDAAQAAINDAAAAITASQGAVVAFGKGLYDLDTKTGGVALQVPVGLANRLRIVGFGSVINLGQQTYSFLGLPSGIAAQSTVRNITVDGFHIVAAAKTASSQGIAVSLQATDVNFDSITVRNITGTCANGLQAGTGRRWVAVGCNRTDAYGATQNTVNAITVENCSFTGGNTGVFIYSFTSAANNPAANFGQTVTRANVVLSRIRVRDVDWDSTTVTTSSFTSSGVQVGGDALMLDARIERCNVKNSGDVGFEMDSCLDLTVRDCTAENCTNEGFFNAPNFGGLPASLVARQMARYIDCTAICSTELPTMAGFVSAARNTVQHGAVVYERCTFVSGRTFAAQTNNPAHSWRIDGPHRLAVVRDCAAVFDAFAFDAIQNSITAVLSGIAVTGAISDLHVDGFRMECNGSLLNTAARTGQSWEIAPINLAYQGRVSLTARRVHVVNNLTRAATVGLIVQLVKAASGSNQLTDTFSSDTLDAGYVWDAGRADLAVSGGALTVTQNPTTEKRARWLQSTASTANQIQRLPDTMMYVQGIPGASVTGYKQGATTRVSDDGATYLDHYVYDDGTTSYLCLDKITAGSRASLLTNGAAASVGAGTVTTFTPVTGASGLGLPLTTRITASTGFGVRGRVRANVLSAAYYTGTSQPSNTTNGAQEVQVTLTGADAQTFGSDAGQSGFVGFSFIAVGTDATLKVMRVDKVMVLAGLLERSRVRLAQAPTQARPVNFAAVTQNLRLDGRLRVRDNDFSGMAAATTIAEFTISDATIKQGFLAERNTYTTPPAASAPTVSASPWTYTCPGPNAEDLFIYGGTVSSITVARDGATAAQVADSTGRVVRLSPGDVAVTTYSSAPTGRVVPAP